MSHEVVWTSKVLEFFIKQANLNETEEWIMRTRCKNMPRSVQKDMLHISMATLDRHIRRIKAKYDAVQREYPDILPERKESAEETYMDTH